MDISVKNGKKNYNLSAEGQYQWEFMIACDTFNLFGRISIYSIN